MAISNYMILVIYYLTCRPEVARCADPMIAQENFALRCGELSLQNLRCGVHCSFSHQKESATRQSY